MAKDDDRTMETVLEIRRHTDKLMSFTTTRPPSFRFRAGQFARLGGDGVWRAYSIVSPEYAEVLDFYVVLIEDGPMSRFFMRMREGDKIALAPESSGFLLPGRFTDGRDLVMLSTGSGIAPFVSQLQDPGLYDRFSRIALVHSVRTSEELVFGEFFETLDRHELVGSRADRLTYIPICTRETGGDRIHARIPEALETGLIQERVPFEFDAATTRFMICGNPAMVADTFAALKRMGFKMHRNKVPGEIIMENGF